MTIQEKLNSLKPYVQSMRFVDDFPIIDAIFKDKWKIPEGNKIKNYREDKTKQFSFYSEDKRIGFDELLEYVEEIIKMNIDLEKKQFLYKEKTKELKELFLNPSNKYEDLLSLVLLLPEKENNDEAIDLFDDDEEVYKEPTPKKVTNEIVGKENIDSINVYTDKELLEKQNKIVLPPKDMIISEEKKDLISEDTPLAETSQPKYEL